MRFTPQTAAAVLGTALAILGTGAGAATTTLTGTFVSYEFDADEMGLLGTASLIGDNLAIAASGLDVATTTTTFAGVTRTVNVTVKSIGGYMLTGFDLSESGSYALTSGTASVNGSLKAVDIEGNTSNQVSQSFGSTTLSGTGTWNAAASLNLPGTGWGGADGVVSSVTLTLTNLASISGSGSLSGGNLSIASYTTAVPEASTYTMLLAGLGLVGFMARRRGAKLI